MLCGIYRAFYIDTVTMATSAFKCDSIAHTVQEYMSVDSEIVNSTKRVHRIHCTHVHVQFTTSTPMSLLQCSPYHTIPMAVANIVLWNIMYHTMVHYSIYCHIK